MLATAQVNHMIIGRHIKKICISLFILIICGISINIYLHNKKNEYIPEPDIKTSRYNRVQSTGFNLTHYDNEDKKLISIKADKFTVEKKKIGFFRTSLFNEAKIINAVIDFYGTVTFLKDSAGNPIKKSTITFKNAFSEKALSSLLGKGVASIKMVPVSLRLYQDDSLITKISASSGRVQIKRRVLAFSGNVTVECGTSKLTTESLIFHPEEAIIKTDKGYELITDKGTVQGTRFESDIYLESG